MPDIPEEVIRHARPHARQAAVHWARAVLSEMEEYVILDTETTGKDPETAEIVQIGIMALNGQVLLDSLVKPPIPIPAEATAIHHITDEMVAQAPTLAELHPQIEGGLSGAIVIVFNARYDANVLNNCRRRAGLPKFGVKQYLCAMLEYAKFVGEWNPTYQNYKWQRLPEGDHTAIGDCWQTLELMRKMAGVEDVPDRGEFEDEEWC